MSRILSLSVALPGLPWAYGTVRNKLSEIHPDKVLPFIHRSGGKKHGRLLVDVQVAVGWMRANGWPGCATKLLAIADSCNAGGVASR